MEWFETLVGIVIWKGVYDLMDIGTQQLFYTVQPNPKEEFWVSLIFTTVISYTIFFVWYLADKPIRTKSTYIFGQYSVYFFDFIDFIVYMAMVGVWRVYWQQFDIIAFDTRLFKTNQESGYFVLAAFFTSIIVCSVLGLNVNLYTTAYFSEAVILPNKKKTKLNRDLSDTNSTDYVVSSSV